VALGDRLRDAPMLTRSTLGGIELMNLQFHIAVVFACGNETEFTAGLEGDEAHHLGFRQIEGANLRIAKGMRYLRRRI
jgi:hypothetical protein